MPESGSLPSEDGETEPQIDNPRAYSWIKSPHYQDIVHEAGPLAIMWVNDDYVRGISVLNRTAARAFETQKVANAMDGWLGDLVVCDPVYAYRESPESATGVGLTEAPRGALGHRIETRTPKISRYQVITPTAWNASPQDDFGKRGSIEEALIGTPVKEVDQPIEVLRVVHSFDPCIACAVHLVSPEGQSLGKYRVS